MAQSFGPRVLIASAEHDDHARHVADLLAKRSVPFAFVDMGCFPRQLGLSFEPTELPKVRACRTGSGDLAFEQVRSIWWRRPRPPAAGPEVADPSVRAFCARESEHAFMGFWLALERILWVNDPSKDRAAHKPYQLATAHRLGMTTPRTLVTNDPKSATDFMEEIGLDRTVYKVLVSDPVCWRETRRLRKEELAYLDRLRHAPVIFQEHVCGRLDVRATVVGDRVFAAAIDATATNYPQDYRLDLAHAILREYALPDSVAGQLVRLSRALGLVYAAADFRVTPEGEHVFLELNPAGQWLFIEQSTGLPIGAALADLLSSTA